MTQEYKERTVFAVRVTTKHLFADFFQWFKNLIGMRLSSYENMIAEAVEGALYELYKKYPNVYDVRITTSQTALGAAEVIVYSNN